MDIILSLGIIIITVMAVYWRTFKLGLICDDVYWKSRNCKNKGFLIYPFLMQIKQRLYSGGTFAYVKDDKCEWSVYYDHVFQTILHLIVCVGIYFTFGTNMVSFFAAMLYAVNPANHQTAIWINGRRYALNIIIMLAMISLGVYGIILYPLTVFLNVNTFFVPLVYGWFGVLAIPAFLLIGWKEIIGKIKSRHARMSVLSDHRRYIMPYHLIVVLKLYGMYFFKMIFPGRVMFSYPHFHYWGITLDGRKQAWSFNKHFYIGLLALALTVCGLFYFKGQMFWFFLVMCLSVLQWSGIIPVTQVFTDRYISLANVFMMFFISYLLLNSSLGILLLLGLFFSYLTNLNTVFRLYENLDSFYEYHMFYDKGNVMASEYWGAEYLFQRKDPLGAWEIVKKGLVIHPKDMKLNMLAAQCMEVLGDKKMVIFYLKIAKDNCYIGQEFVYKKIQNNIFKIDLDAEVEKINNKESKLDKKVRENILKIHETLNS